MSGKLTRLATRGRASAVGKLDNRSEPISKINDHLGRPLDALQRARSTNEKSRHSETLAKKSFDPLWEAMIRVFGEASAARRAFCSKIVEGIVLIARVYEREAERWETFLAERGVKRPRRGPISRSRFHGLAKHVLEIDSDEDGTACRLAAILDQWHAERGQIAPHQIPKWIVSQGGITRLYESAGTQRDAGWRNPKPTQRQHLTWDADEETSSLERYTPKELFTAMDVVFDTDVCSPGEHLVPWIPARRHITARQNTLSMGWDDLGFVFMNSPWGIRNRIEEWIEKFIQHANGVALVPDFTSAAWWHKLCGAADVIMAVKPKIQFHPRVRGRGNVMGSTVAAIGSQGVQALRNAERNGRGICFARLPTDAPIPNERLPNNAARRRRAVHDDGAVPSGHI